MSYQKISGFIETMGDNATSSMFYHSMFRKNWRRTLEREQSEEEKKNWIKYDVHNEVYIYEDLKDILKIMDLHPDDRDKNRDKFKDYISTLTKIQITEQPCPFTWYNTTTRGINLRPGRQGGSNRLQNPVIMQGENTHGIVAGTTGSGKSVFLNNLILNLMVEYPPWELELYLADFKKVEMSRYMNTYASPHVKACAATSEIDYVQSLIQYIKERMDDRQKLFSRLGYTDIESFRVAYPQLVVPRILFLVDEFQQLFLDATSAQKSVIEDLITNITRLGRAQGVHLLFASQDMSGALNQKQLSNFNIRFALLCDAAISEDILGNNEATKLKIGQVIAKTKTTSNEVFSVPIAIDPITSKRKEGEDEYFFRILKEFVDYADKLKYCYRKTQKFYQEDEQLELDSLGDLLERSQVKNIRTFSGEEGSKEARQNFMSLVLGRKVVYSNAEYDIENIFISYAKNRCILCLSGNSSDLAYFQKLIALNIRTMKNEKSEQINSVNLDFGLPFFYDLNPLVSSLYPEKERIRDLRLRDPYHGNKYVWEENEEEIEAFKDRYFYYRAEELDELRNEYEYRKKVLELLRNSRYRNAKECCIAIIRNGLMENGMTDEEEISEIISIYSERGLGKLMENDSNILCFLAEDLDYLGFVKEDIVDFLKIYYRYRVLGIRPSYKIFKPILIWITGIENLERIPNWFSEFASNATDYNFLVMFFSSATVNYTIKQASNYIFVSGFDPKLYDDYLNKRIGIGENGLKFHALIKNTNQCFAFKKYRCQMNSTGMKSINFDELFSK